jgi:hypothetical protein
VSDFRVLHGPDTDDPGTLVEHLRSAGTKRSPFDTPFMDFTAELSQALRRSSLGTEPAVAALSYWIRPASLRRLASDWSEENRALELVRVPRGVVFHLPPTNVDTLFVYSWLLSAAVGNANVIRLSPKALDDLDPLLSIMGRLLRDHPAMGSTTSLVSYGHDDRITEALSMSDMRVIWGGDESVRTIRSIPLPPSSMEVAFADRFSLAALDARAVTEVGDGELTDLARRFFNDAYWFDQLGCASPRAVVWCGDEGVIDRAATRFWGAVREELGRRGVETPASAAIAKLVYAAELAIEGATNQIDWRDARMTRMQSSTNAKFHRDSPGGGLFVEHHVSSLAGIAPLLARKDQTLTYFGFEQPELLHLVRSATGIDRCVPIGTALDFGRLWDGFDLLAAFSRIVDIRS